MTMGMWHPKESLGGFSCAVSLTVVAANINRLATFGASPRTGIAIAARNGKNSILG
jgi:hypothetical protein